MDEKAHAKKLVDNLIDATRFYANSDHSYGSYQRVHEANGALISFGHKEIVSGFLLDAMNELCMRYAIFKEEDEDVFFHLVMAAKDVIVPHYVAQLAWLLVQPAVISCNHDRSTRCFILETVRDHGTKAALPALEEFRGRIASIPYQASFAAGVGMDIEAWRRSDIYDLDKAVAAVKCRE